MNDFPTPTDETVMPFIRALIGNPEKKLLMRKLVTSVIEILSLDPTLANILNPNDISIIIATIFGQNSMMESSGQEGLVAAYQDVYLLTEIILALANKYSLSSPFNDFESALELANRLNSSHSEADLLGNLDFVNALSQLTAH